MDNDKPYEDKDFIEKYKLPSMNPEESIFLISHKATGDMYRVRAKDREELAFKISIGEWEPDPRNEPDPEEEE